MRKFLLGFFKVLIFGCFLLSVAIFSGVATVRYILATSKVDVPDVVGKDLEYATDVLAERHLQLKIVERQINTEFQKDRIIAQDPEAGAKRKKNQVVRLVVSGGIETTNLPNVVGRSWQQAKRMLRQQKFRIGNVAYAHSSEAPVDAIIAQSPFPHATVDIGTSVDLLVSRGSYKNVMVMPDLVEQDLTYALGVIEKLGLVKGNVAYEDYDVRPNMVLSHIPRPGALVEEQNMVTLVVSKGGGRSTSHAANSVQYQSLEYIVPPGPFEREISVIVKNVEGIAEVYREFVAPGVFINVQIPVIGPTVVEIFVDGTLDVIRRMNHE